MMHKKIEVYVDDIIAKSQEEESWKPHEVIWDVEKITVKTESIQMHIQGYI